MEDCSYKVEGFLKDASFTADLRSWIMKFKDKFPGLTKLHLHVEELSLGRILHNDSQAITFSEDRSELIIHYTYHKWYNPQGKVTGRPSIFEVKQDIETLINIASDQFNKE